MRLCEPFPHPCRGRGGWGDEKKKGEGRERRERREKTGLQRRGKRDRRVEGRKGKAEEKKRQALRAKWLYWQVSTNLFLYLKQSLLEKRERK